jgi:hypothetical protein
MTHSVSRTALALVTQGPGGAGLVGRLRSRIEGRRYDRPTVDPRQGGSTIHAERRGSVTAASWLLETNAIKSTHIRAPRWQHWLHDGVCGAFLTEDRAAPERSFVTGRLWPKLALRGQARKLSFAAAAKDASNRGRPLSANGVPRVRISTQPWAQHPGAAPTQQREDAGAVFYVLSRSSACATI